MIGKIMKRIANLLALACCLCILSGTVWAQKKNRKIPRVCGDPDKACKGRANFQPYELPVEWPQNTVIAESEPFYAIILKSAKSNYSSGADCDKLYSNDEIQSIQFLFPRNKVFALKCFEPGLNYYTNVGNDVVFLGVYAGRTRTEATKFLRKLRGAGQFSNAQLRRMRVGMNGT